MSPEQARGQDGGPAGGHLGVWVRAVRNADGEDGIRRRDGDGHAGGGASRGAGLVAATCGDADPRSGAVAALLAERPEAAAARHRRRAHFARRSSLGRTARGANARRTRGRSGKPLFGWIPAAIVAIPLLLLAALAFVHFREKPQAAPALNLSVPVPENAIAGFVALSPDGRRLVIMLFDGEMDKLWIRSLDSPQLQLLPGTEYARAPFWSPDSKSIGFFADGELKTVPATGGPPQVLCGGTGIAADGTWNRDGVILFSTSGVNDPLQRVNATGGACTLLTHPEAGTTHIAPEFLPDGKHFVYVVNGDNEAARGLYLASLDNPAPRRLLTDDSSAVFAPSTTGKDYGYLLFLRGKQSHGATVQCGDAAARGGCVSRHRGCVHEFQLP